MRFLCSMSNRVMRRSIFSGRPEKMDLRITRLLMEHRNLMGRRVEALGKAVGFDAEKMSQRYAKVMEIYKYMHIVMVAGLKKREAAAIDVGLLRQAEEIEIQT